MSDFDEYSAAHGPSVQECLLGPPEDSSDSEDDDDSPWED